MIPEFPQFKGLELSDKSDVEAHTKKFPPYSDFNFVSMWSWDIKGEMRISQLNNNLVVRFTDYLTGKPFFSFLGDNMVNETVETLLEYSKQEGLGEELKLVPEDCIKDIDKNKFKEEEDRDHHDYLYSVSELKNMEGGKFAKKRNQVALFMKNHPKAEVKVFDLKDINIQGQMTSLFSKWLQEKIKEDEIFESHEKIAVNRMLLALETCNLMGIGVFHNEKLEGFFINELTDSEHIVAHISKTNKELAGINSFLTKHNAVLLHPFEKQFFNYEQDLGIENLRVAKTRFRPIHFLKKYKLTYL
ncbi:MAG: phosphatidylglycerol lysyltransferase domain-containing protein [bacterium]|nr:phosphatidylglycerol lysyltransferase domain-containing protein [bacterium]